MYILWRAMLKTEEKTSYAINYDNYIDTSKLKCDDGDVKNNELMKKVFKTLSVHFFEYFQFNMKYSLV